jgi:alkaline phosphatase
MLNLRPSLSLLLSFSILSMNCSSGAKKIAEKVEKPLNIILMIGDGMGLAQISAASFVYKGLYLETLKHIGLVKTSSSDDYITDSAAGATAYSTGEKTYNGAIGLGPDSLPRVSILELAEKAGMSTGLISTCSVTHATPASFFSHQKSREMHKEIASDFYGKGIDFVAGTGKPYFDLERLKQDGYMIHTGKDVPMLQMGQKSFLFFNDSIHPPKAMERNFWLTNVTSAGLNHLSGSPKGFFLMVEGSQIDWGGHDNDLDYTVSELKDFDTTIEAVIEFAMRDGNTLVIITADHETGGLSLNAGDFSTRKLDVSFATGHHSGVMVPVFAFGPGAENFQGVMENTDIFNKMKSMLKL